MKKLITLWTLLLCVCSSAWAVEEEISLTSYTVADGVATLTSGDVTVVLSRNGGNADSPASNSRGFRWQNTRVITVTIPTGYKINYVKLTSNKNGNNLGDIQYTLTDGSDALSGSWDNEFRNGKKDDYTWTPTSGMIYNTWVLTNSGTNGDIYFSKVTVNYEVATVTNAAPTIVTQPAATLDAYVGYEAELIVAASGYPVPTYQWYSNTTNSNTGGTAIEGATSASYKFTPTATGTYYYYAVATNTFDSSDHSVTSNVSVVTVGSKYKVAFAAGESGAEVSVPLEEADYLPGDMTLPTNHYFYKEGSSVAKWTDGTNEYNLGSTYSVASDVTFNPVFAENIKNMGDEETTITWTFSRAAGSPIYAIEGVDKSTAVIATTANGIDLKMDVATIANPDDETKYGKFNNTSYTDRAQVNAWTTFTIPALSGMIVKYTSTNGTPNVADDVYFGTDKATSVEGSNYVYQYTGSETTLTIIDRKGNLYPSGITVTYPCTVVALPTISVEASATSVMTNEVVTLTATVTGNPAPAIQWYSNTTASNVGGTAIENANAATYAPATNVIGTFYYYAVASNSEGSATSDVVSLTVAGSDKCQLTQIVYSNSFDAFINEPTDEKNGTIKAFYMAGSDVPTIANAIVSEGADYAVDGTTLTVTAEDGITTAVYEITLAPVTPYNGADKTFDGTENWIKAGAGFSSDKGWKFQKNADDGRIPQGRTRIYFFVGKTESVDLINGLINSDRNIEVYVNGVKNTTITKVPKKTSSITIPCSTTDNNLIAIISNQTGGDGGFSGISLPNPANVNITATKEYSSFCSTYDLDFTSVENLEAYVVSAINFTSASVEKVEKVPAGTGLLLKKKADIGTASEFVLPVATSTDEISTNHLVGVTVATNISNIPNVYLLKDGMFLKSNGGTLAAGKAYLVAELWAQSDARSFSIDDDGTTNIKVVNNSSETMGGWYNLAGQRVAVPEKGLYIVNGKKVIIK